MGALQLPIHSVNSSRDANGTGVSSGKFPGATGNLKRQFCFFFSGRDVPNGNFCSKPIFDTSFMVSRPFSFRQMELIGANCQHDSEMNF